MRAAPAQKLVGLRVADSPSLVELDRLDRSELVRTVLALLA